eukprot:GILI01020898.1.p1 GENE.GILI01020898.1~~GILI01020898.1.p1  ORF type:complete len:178 (-),score=26.17 GILI01020898.1:608-1141(-)
MGANTSSLRPEEIADLQEISNFSQKEIKRLYKRFRKLDRSSTGVISAEEFLMIPELAMNPLVHRVISMFDSDHDQQINFRDFVQALSVFSGRGSREEKLRFAFKVYDIDNDGFINNSELFEILKMMVGSNLSDTQIQQIVDKTITDADTDRDGRLSFEEFVRVMDPGDIDSKMTIAF